VRQPTHHARAQVGKALLSLRDLPADGRPLTVWLPLEPVNPGQSNGQQGAVLLDVTLKAFEDDEQV
jgi:hypothetical protein